MAPKKWQSFGKNSLVKKTTIFSSGGASTGDIWVFSLKLNHDINYIGVKDMANPIVHARFTPPR